MGIRRRRPRTEPEVSLDDLVAPYSTDRLPSTGGRQQAIGARRCPRCGRTVVYDARRAPGDCPWCQLEQRIDLDRGDRLAIRNLGRPKRGR